MVKRQVDINIFGPFKSQVSRPWLRSAVKQVLERELPGESYQLSLVIADDDTIRCLNKDYRGLDEVTDVLSFSTTHQGHWEGEGEAPRSYDDQVPFVLPPEEPPQLGEVIISYPQALRQATPGPSGPLDELASLVVHGVLHLLGFDHVEPQEGAEMQQREREILSGLIS